MIDFNLLTLPTASIPVGLPATPREVLAADRAIDRKKNEHSQFEMDAFDYSGKRSYALASAPLASVPVATSGLPVDLKEDDSARTHEAASGLVSTAGAAVRQVASTLMPAALAVGTGFTMFGGGGGGGSAGGTERTQG